MEMNERLKHRVIGLAVIISIAIIFLPALFKKSKQRLKNTVNIQLKLPDKPQEPTVAFKNKKELFQETRVAHVELTKVDNKAPAVKVAKASKIKPSKVLAKKQSPSPKPKLISTAKKKVPSPLITKKKITQKSTIKKYSVQIAAFSKPSNAHDLVSQLKKKGYQSRVVKSKGRKRDLYKVYVGKKSNRQEALSLKNSLASNFKLKGFIVKTGVS